MILWLFWIWAVLVEVQPFGVPVVLGRVLRGLLLLLVLLALVGVFGGPAPRLVD